MFISYEDTESAADDFLSQYHSGREIPVPIERIIELKLEISIVPRMGLKSQDNVDAFLSHDFTELYIDHDEYMGQTNRSRFTLAHEIGHFVLHKDVISKIKTLDQWKKFVLGEGTGRAIYEIHANNFAGCVLLPRPEVSNEYDSLKDKALKSLKKMGMKSVDDKTLISFIATEIADKFHVSPKVAEIRLSKIFLKT